jgi:PKHD-type hydroxylase
MLLHVPEVLTPAQVAMVRRELEHAEWIDGRITAGHQSARAKSNTQIRENTELAERLGTLILDALQTNALFATAALPLRVFPPLFNRYQIGDSFGTHVDNAIRQIPGTPHRIRTDLSATLFFSEPDDYDGGELDVEDTFGVHQIKLPAGHMILYPASSLHHVRPVTHGVRLASFFWIQSLVRDDAERTLLFDLDIAIQQLRADAPDLPAEVQLTNVYHNLLRRWADL